MAKDKAIADKIEESFMPNMVVVETAEDIEGYVEKVGLSVSAQMNKQASEELESVQELTRCLELDMDKIGDEDVKKWKEILAAKKEYALWFQSMATKYDGIGPSNKSTQAINNLKKVIGKIEE